MTKCGECIHWKRSKFEDDWIGECSCVYFVDTSRDFGQDGDPQTPLSGLGYSDKEQYAATFKTGEEFGCVHGKITK